jgi:hypothetical protein
VHRPHRLRPIHPKALLIGLLFFLPATAQQQPTLSNAAAQALVRTVLKREDAALRPTTVWMRYRIRKSSPRLSTTKWIVETRDGDVAHLIAWNDQPLSANRSELEASRLQSLLADPSLQRHRKQREAVDTERLRKIIHALPNAFVYHYAGTIATADGPAYRLTFQSNPSFDPFDLETQVLKGMVGELWINAAAKRVVRLQCRRIRDVDYGLGLFAKLDQGGTLLIEQHRVAGDQWRITNMLLRMNARVLFREISLDTQLEMTDFAVVAPAMDYRAGITLLHTLPEDESHSR